MIKYFKELENKENQILKLIEESLFKTYFIFVKALPLEYYEKYKDVFLELSHLNILEKVNNERINYFTDKESLFYMDFGYTFMDSYLSHEPMDFVLTTDGKNKLDFLVSKIKYDSQEIDFYDCLSIYVEAVVSLFLLDDVIIENRDQVARYLESSMKVLTYQKRLSDKLKMRLTEALKELEKYQVEIPLKPYSPYDLKLPNSWYITPFKRLYNTTGKDGHKEANLIYPYRHIFKEKINLSPAPYLKASYKILEDGYITNSDYLEYLNFKYEFPSIYPSYYYFLENVEKIFYRQVNKRSYNPLLVKIVDGVISAQAGMYNFFYRLRLYSNDYERD